MSDKSSASPATSRALTGVLDDIEEYLEQRQDVRDGEDGVQLPNEAMSLLSRLAEARTLWARSVLSETPRIETSPEDMTASLRYLHLSTAPDGQWADQAVHSFVGAMLKSAPKATLQSRDWTEDADHENGKYSCWCTSCESAFIGHKRRTICKLCALSATPCSADELKRLREIEHLAWHVLDDSAEDATTGNISIVPRDDYFKLCELLPEGHP